MSKRLLRCVTLLAVALIGGSVAAAQTGGPVHHMPGGPGKMPMAVQPLAPIR